MAPESRHLRAYLPWSQFGESYHRQRQYQWPVYLSVITVRFVMAHMVAVATGKDQESEKVHTLRSRWRSGGYRILVLQSWRTRPGGHWFDFGQGSIPPGHEPGIGNLCPSPGGR